MNRTFFGFFALAGATALMAGCPGPDDNATTSPSTSSSGSTSTSGAGGSSSSSSSSGGSTTLQTDYTADATISGPAELHDTMKIEKGVTVTFAAGTVVKTAVGTQIKVSGTLKLAGEAGKEVTFQSGVADEQALWLGIEVEAGGNLDAKYVTLLDANTGIATTQGGLYTIANLTVSNTSTPLDLESTGTVDHAKLNGVGGTIVQIGQMNSSLPKFTNSWFLGTKKGDGELVRVRGNQSSPSFDHCEFAHGRTGLRLEQGTKIAVTASYFHDLQNAIDVNGTTKDTVNGSNFENNDNNISNCNMGSDITATGCYFDMTPFDMNCMAMMNKTPSMSKLGGVGPQ